MIRCTVLAIFISFIAADSVINPDTSPGLDALYKKLMEKHEIVKNRQLIEFIHRAAPSGIDAPIPSIAEYETFRSDKSVNFLSDGQGHVVFREFRRIRISDLLGSQMKNRNSLGL